MGEELLGLKERTLWFRRTWGFSTWEASAPSPWWPEMSSTCRLREEGAGEMRTMKERKVMETLPSEGRFIMRGEVFLSTNLRNYLLESQKSKQIALVFIRVLKFTVYVKLTL